MKECPSCRRQVSRLDEDQPPSSDTEAWRQIAGEHAPDCDWVRTHAPANQSLAAARAESGAGGGSGGGGEGGVPEPVDTPVPGDGHGPD